MKQCYSRPTPILNWPLNCDYVMFIDENNSNSAINNVRDKIFNGGTISKDENYFTITGCIFSKSDYRNTKNSFDELKMKYWNTTNVCFHSYEIRNKKESFKMDNDTYESFIIDLDERIKESNYTIISITIDIENYILYSKYNSDIYEIAFDFLLERFIYFMGSNNKGAIMLEARGKKEDKKLLSHIASLINITGTTFIDPIELDNKVEGVYFNPKFNVKNKTTFIGLEVADLSSYPIHKYIKYKKEDKAFLTLKLKLNCYPDYKNKGLKIYP